MKAEFISNVVNVKYTKKNPVITLCRDVTQ